MPYPPRELRPHESARAFFGAELRHWRNIRGYSQEDLGRLTLHSEAAISKVEKASRWPTEQLAQRCDMVLETGGSLRRLLPLVLAERRVNGGRDGREKSRRRVTLPAVDYGVVERPDVQNTLLTALLAAAEASQPAPVVLGGPGGFGKTTLALRLCHDERVARHFDEVLWIETGQDCTPARVVQLAADLCEQLDGTRPTLVSPEQAGFHLAEVLGERAALLVVDNVWSPDDLTPFLLGALNCVRLVTTRNLGMCRSASATVRVPPMTTDEVMRLLENNSPTSSSGDSGLRTLASTCGGWPLLASVVGASVAQDISAGATKAVAVDRATNALHDDGPQSLDVWDSKQRAGTIGRVVASSLRHLDTEIAVQGGKDLGDRYLDLAVFPPSVAIPVPILAAWWRQEHGWTATSARQFARLLAERSLVGAYLADEDAVVLHDVFRSALIAHTRGPAHKSHHSLVESFRAQAPEGWHRVDRRDDYVWRHLTHHLDQAGHHDEVAETLCDPTYVLSKLRAVGHDPLIEDAQILDRIEQKVGRQRVVVARALVDAAYLAADLSADGDIGSTLLAALAWAGQLDGAAAQRLRSTDALPFDVRWARPHVARGVGHTGAVTAVAVHGNRVVSAGEDGSVRVWDRAARRLVRTLHGHHGWVYAVAISAVADVIASAGDDATIRLWSASTGRLVGVLPGHGTRVRALAFARSGRFLVSGGEDGAIIVWSVQPPAQLRAIASDGSPVWSVAVGCDDELIAVGGEDDVVRVFDAGTGDLVSERSAHRDWVRAVEFARAAPLLASGSGDGTVCLWSVAEGQLTLLRSTYVGDRTRALTISADGGVVEAAGEDATVRAVTASGVMQESRLPAHVDWVRAMARDDRNESVLGCEDGAVRLLRDGSLHEIAAGEGTVWSTAFSSDGTAALLGHHDGTIEVCDSARGATGARLDVGGGRVWALDTAGDLVAAVCGDGRIRVRFLSDPERVVVPDDDGRRGWAVAVAPTGGRVAASAGAGYVQMWDGATGELVWRINGHSGRVRSLSFDGAGHHLVTGGGDGAARVWNAGTGELEFEASANDGWVRSVAIDVEASCIALGLGSGDISIRFLDDSARQVHLFGHSGRILGLAFLEDGGLVSAAADGTVRLWSVGEQRQRGQVRIAASLQCAAMHPASGSVLAGSSSGVIALTLPGHATRT